MEVRVKRVGVRVKRVGWAQMETRVRQAEWAQNITEWGKRQTIRPDQPNQPLLPAGTNCGRGAAA